MLTPRPGDDALWLAERTGTVRRLRKAADGSLKAVGDPVLDISDRTEAQGEQGLLGMAFDESGDTLFVSFTGLDGNSNVEAYRTDGDAVDEGSRRTVFEVEQPFPNHNGGNIVLGPDGRLWLGMGDGGAGDDPENRAQDDLTPLGKLLAIDLSTGKVQQVAKGLRNPWRFAFDSDGSLWIGDVGQNTTEEVDHVAANEIEGANFGWSGYEGSAPYLDGDGRRPDDAVPPVFEYGRDGGACSIVGGFPYRGKELSGLEGAFLFTDYCVGRIRAVRLDEGGDATATDLEVAVERPMSFGTDADGEAYVLSESGTITRLSASG
ncbi:MAG: PQQ-dependent sugar dehydrogenase [Acidimicrobiia bacterium]|nr:PQQ-dependent sugar dehydrogenase [Acidimicrobiia bacterium]